MPFKPRWVAGVVIVFVLGTTLDSIYKKFHQRAVERGKLNESKFIREYSHLLRGAFDIAHDLDSYNTVEYIERARVSLLKVICAVAELYARNEHPGLSCNANVMEAMTVSEFQRTCGDVKVSFVDPVRELTSYETILVIVKWATDSHCVEPLFALAVDKDKKRILFGAPRAFAEQTSQVVANVKDTKEISSLLKGQPQTVEDDVFAYFKRRSSFVSFASMPLTSGDRKLGVVNINANRKCVFGDRKAREEDMMLLMEPVVSILALVAKRSDVVVKQTITESESRDARARDSAANRATDIPFQWRAQ